MHWRTQPSDVRDLLCGLVIFRNDIRTLPSTDTFYRHGRVENKRKSKWCCPESRRKERSGGNQVGGQVGLEVGIIEWRTKEMESWVGAGMYHILRVEATSVRCCRGQATDREGPRQTYRNSTCLRDTELRRQHEGQTVPDAMS